MRRAVCQLLFYLTYCAKKYRHVSQLGLSDLWRELKLLKSTMFRAKSESYLFADLFKNVETAVYVNLHSDHLTETWTTCIIEFWPKSLNEILHSAKFLFRTEDHVSIVLNVLVRISNGVAYSMRQEEAIASSCFFLQTRKLTRIMIAISPRSPGFHRSHSVCNTGLQLTYWQNCA